MNFLAPWALWVAGAVSAAVIVLHILASKNPKVTALPTTRFIPDVPLRATARALRLSDVLLLLLRVAAVMLVGVALARPELTRARRAVGRVVIVDHSAHARDRGEGADSASRYYTRGDVLFSFDSAAHRIRGDAAVAALRAENSPAVSGGSLSAALVAGMRSASELRGEADSVELVVISPLAQAEFDAASRSIRAAWPGRVRLVRTAAADSAATPVNVEVRGATLDDPVRVAVSMMARADTLDKRTRLVRLDRGAPGASDTSVAKLGSTYVRWPASLDSSGWGPRPRADTAGGVIGESNNASGAVVVSTFARTVEPAAGRVVARWLDGSPAATERASGSRCIRDVVIPVARSGDLVLRESTRRLIAELARPCFWTAASIPASDSALARLAGTGPLVATRALASRTTSQGHLTTWLLVAALALLLIEPLLRRQRAAA